MASLHQIVVPMIGRGSLSIPGDEERFHRGVWYYDPELFPNIQVGDTVQFVNNGEVLERGRVVELLGPQDGRMKFCSGINQKGFRWE